MEKKPKLGARLLTDTRGLTTVEYAIVLCLIAVVGISAWETFGETLGKRIGGANEAVQNMGGAEG